MFKDNVSLRELNSTFKNKVQDCNNRIQNSPPDSRVWIYSGKKKKHFGKSQGEIVISV